MDFYVNRILIAAAVIPAIFLLAQIYRADKLEKEPVGLLCVLVGLGFLATFLAVASENVGAWILDLFFYENTLIYQFLMNFLVVACSEEGFKYLLLRRRTWNSKEFNCQFDGVVYAVAVSLGFALLENIGYVMQYGFATALVRAVTAVPGHGCFGVFMGAYYGMAKRYDNLGYPGKSRSCRRMAVAVPALLHGTYDFIASIDTELFGLAFLVFVIVMFAAASRMVKKLSKNDRFIQYRSELEY